MATAEFPALAACPACVTQPATVTLAERRRAAARQGITLSLPGVTDGAGMARAEAALTALPGVQSARVNLTLRRAVISADSSVHPAQLTEALARAGITASELDSALLTTSAQERQMRDLLMRLGVAGFAMMNIMLLSVAVWSGADAATRDLFHWISALIALPTLVFAGQPFFASALASLRAGKLGMDVPISLALILSVSMSLFETIAGGAHTYFDAALSLCFFLLAGRYLDYRSRAAARSAAEELAALEVPRAIRLRDGRQEFLPLSEIATGDLVLVLPGGRAPVDGQVVAGQSELDRSLLTGESQPVFCAPGQMVAAGEVNLTGPLTLRVTAAGRDSSLHRLADLVAIAEGGRSRYVSLADRMARAYAPLVHVLALAAFVGWMAKSGGDLRLSLNIAAAVLIITCPCALALAVPSVVAAASGRLFRLGLLVKDGTALERLATVTHVIFDKTGTLTLGQPDAENLDTRSDREKAIALALASASSHPLSQALAAALGGQVPTPVALTDLRELPGFGVEGRMGETLVRLGRAEWLGAASQAQSASWLKIGTETPVPFTFVDKLRPGVEETLEALHADGLQVSLISGDAVAPVAALAERLRIGDWQAEMLPDAKAAHVADLAARGARVLMVGDGLNDTAALAGAHVSLSPATALDAARVASDIVWLGTSLTPLVAARRTAVLARRRIGQNFALSIGYNLLAVPLALAGLATPLIAALAMSTSSLCVTLNALRLR
ncbi:MAG: heavy metal translocating P-type ATPase [Paracoccaceae bacterium]